MKTMMRKKEVAERWGISTDVIDGMVQRGTLHPRNEIARGLFLLSEVEAIEQAGIKLDITSDVKRMEKTIKLQQQKISFLEGKLNQLREVLAV